MFSHRTRHAAHAKFGLRVLLKRGESLAQRKGENIVKGLRGKKLTLGCDFGYYVVINRRKLLN